MVKTNADEATAEAPSPVLRLWKCACGKVKIQLTGEPFLINNCHCTACYPVAVFVDAAGDGGGTSAVTLATGVAKAMFFLENVKYISGKELLKPIKLGEGGRNVRSYTSCCHTLCNTDGGAGNPPFGFRPFNRLAIYNTDGSPFLPLAPVMNTQGESNPKWGDVPDPKTPGFPEADEKLAMVPNGEWGAGNLLNDITPGLYTDPAKVELFIPIPTAARSCCCWRRS
jgi:hypothetical protein